VPRRRALAGAVGSIREERVRTRLAVVSAAAAFAVVVAGPLPAASAAPSSSVVVNEVYGGGGNSGAPFTNDFVELSNRAAADVSVDGCS
jgi:hypothetical protein